MYLFLNYFYFVYIPNCGLKSYILYIRSKIKFNTINCGNLFIFFCEGGFAGNYQVPKVKFFLSKCKFCSLVVYSKSSKYEF